MSGCQHFLHRPLFSEWPFCEKALKALRLLGFLFVARMLLDGRQQAFKTLF